MRGLGEDFHDYTVIFVGSKLDQPLIFQHISAALQAHEVTGQSYLVTPDALSAIKMKSLEQRDISHIPGTLEDLVQSLLHEFPNGIQPHAVETAALAGALGSSGGYTQRDIDALRSIYPVSELELQKRFSNPLTNSRWVRNFYEGYGPSWPVILGAS